AGLWVVRRPVVADHIPRTISKGCGQRIHCTLIQLPDNGIRHLTNLLRKVSRVVSITGLVSDEGLTSPLLDHRGVRHELLARGERELTSGCDCLDIPRRVLL